MRVQLFEFLTMVIVVVALLIALWLLVEARAVKAAAKPNEPVFGPVFSAVVPRPSKHGLIPPPPPDAPSGRWF